MGDVVYYKPEYSASMLNNYTRSMLTREKELGGLFRMHLVEPKHTTKCNELKHD